MRHGFAHFSWSSSIEPGLASSVCHCGYEERLRPGEEPRPETGLNVLASHFALARVDALCRIADALEVIVEQPEGLNADTSFAAAPAGARCRAMARRRTKSWLKVAGAALVVVVGYDLYKAHTGLPAPTVNRNRVA